MRGRGEESALECEEGEKSQLQNKRKESSQTECWERNFFLITVCHSSYVLPAVMARRGPFNVAYIWIMEQYKIHIIFAIIPT